MTAVTAVEQVKALRRDKLDLSPRNLFGALERGGQDERSGGHGTQLSYLWRRLQTVIRGGTGENNGQKSARNRLINYHLNPRCSEAIYCARLRQIKTGIPSTTEKSHTTGCKA